MRLFTVFLFHLLTLTLWGQGVMRHKTVIEGDTLDGIYTDHQFSNEGFTSYAIVACRDGFELTGPSESRSTYKEVWQPVASGCFYNGERAGEWIIHTGTPGCESRGSLNWKRVTYLGDSLEVSDYHSIHTMTADSVYIRGHMIGYGKDYPNWECMNGQCKVWYHGKRDTIEASFTKVLMTIDTHEWKKLFR
jgi:sarcosine oxidase delta subunit